VATPSSQEELLATIVATAGALAMRATDPVRAVGVGLPSSIRRPSGRVASSVNVALEGVVVEDELARRIGRPVVADNDGNLAALAEARAGAARGAAVAVMLTLGTGVGGGVVVDGRIMRGAHGTGAELGHLVVDPDGPPCPGRCPSRGCLEAVASGTAVGLAGAAAAAADPGGALGRAAARGEVTARVVGALAAEGDPGALAVLGRAGRGLGVGLASLANVFDPEVFVIGGGAAALGAPLLGPAEDEMRARALAPHAGVPLRRAVLGAEAGVLGAALLAAERAAV
jgi:glucokinase